MKKKYSIPELSEMRKLIGEELLYVEQLLAEAIRDAQDEFNKENPEILRKRSLTDGGFYRDHLRKYLDSVPEVVEKEKRRNLLEAGVEKIKDYWDDAVEDFLNIEIEIWN